MNSQPCVVRPTLIGMNLFLISLDRCDESCNTVEYPLGRICVPNEVEYVNLKVFNEMKRKTESKTPVKHFI